ncbi:MAG: cyclic nucleotide-binding domain-containing protein [Chloroflexi bacterium]|nr:cyclic nucleotide-binding domain-containing protein [Chloroflexota bacterium]
MTHAGQGPGSHRPADAIVPGAGRAGPRTAGVPARPEAGRASESPAAEDRAFADPNDLRAIPLFQSLTDQNLRSLARTVTRRVAAAGQVLCREGDGGHEMYVVLRGTVTLTKAAGDRETELGRLESGAYFGEMALIGEAPRSATIRAATDLDYLAIDRDTLMSVIGQFPTVALQILRGYNDRLADTTERLAHLSARATPAEIALVRSAAGQVDFGAPDGEASLADLVERLVLYAPHPLAVLARRLLVEDQWDRKMLLALDVFELTVKYTLFLLLADYLRRPTIRTPDVDQMVVAAFRRPTLGLLLDMCPRVLKAYAAQDAAPFVPGVVDLHVRREGGRSACGRALQALTTYRNRLKHGAEGVWDDETFRRDFEGRPEERLPNGEPRLGIQHHLAAILDAVGFLKEYPLVFLNSMTYEHGAFEYAYERCTGAYSSFDRGVFATREPLENRRLYVFSQGDEQALALDPFLRRQKCPTCNTVSIFLLFSATADKEKPRRDAALVSAPADAADARPRRRERLEYLSYACGHTLVQVLAGEQIERGEGVSHLFE